MDISTGSERHLRRAIALALAGSAAIHLGATATHVHEYPPAGVFMLATGVAQYVLSIWIARGASLEVTLYGAVGNLGIVSVWLASRTTGLPFGVMRWVPEHIHSADALCTELELIAVLATVMLISPALPKPGRRLELVAGVGAFSSVFASAHNAAMERATAVAALLSCITGYVVAQYVTESVASYWARREHVQVTYVLERVAAGNAGVGAARGASSHAYTASRHHDHVGR